MEKEEEYVEPEQEFEEMCYDCKVNKADHSLLGYYEACRPCYDEHIRIML